MTLLQSKQQFRFTSRKLLKHPSDFLLHKQRIHLALDFCENDPAQGALADFFYGCWYDVPFKATKLLEKAQNKLQPWVLQQFLIMVENQTYLPKVNTLATGWSVLVTPSLAVPRYRLRSNRDYSVSKVQNLVAALLDAQKQADSERIQALENDFFTHCIVCEDRLAFMQAWFKLHKHGWQFNQQWTVNREQVERFSQ